MGSIMLSGVSERNRGAEIGSLPIGFGRPKVGMRRGGPRYLYEVSGGSLSVGILLIGRRDAPRAHPEPLLIPPTTHRRFSLMVAMTLVAGTAVGRGGLRQDEAPPTADEL